MPRRALDRIRQQVRGRVYEILDHALDEAAEDGYDVLDIEAAILQGAVRRRFTQDLRGTRFEIIGPTADSSRRVAVVGRFHGEVFRIITVYDPDEEDES